MRIYWRQWEPNPENRSDSDAIAKTINQVVMGEPERFMKYWHSWIDQYPRALKLITLAHGESRQVVQLRFWHGEPLILRNYVSSGGHNLIVHAEAEFCELFLLRLFVQMLLPTDRPHTKEVINGVEVWRIIDE